MRASDARAVAALSGELGYPSRAADVRRRFSALASDRDAALLVAEDPPGAVVGWIHVAGRRSLESAAYADLGGLVVGAAARRRGVGARLVASAETWARRRGYGVLRVRSNVRRRAARGFYLALGYAIAKTQRVYVKSLRP